MMTNTCQVDADRCTGCGACVEACPHGALTLRGGIASLDAQLCRGCGVCVDICPVGAISLGAPVPPVRPAAPQFPVPRRAEYSALAVSRPNEVAPRAPSLLARISGALVPSALDLVAALGETWLNRVIDRGAGIVTAPAPTWCGARQRRRTRGGGRGWR